jgi:SNF2 family DNA or RNA helicase
MINVNTNSIMENIKYLLSKNDIELIAPHQTEGVQWLLNKEKSGCGGLLCDDMGLGKTMQIASLIIGNPMKMTLIVVPPVVIEQWLQCINRVINGLDINYRVLTFIGKNAMDTVSEIIKSRTDSDDKHFIVIVSYQMIIRRQRYLRRESCTPRLGFIWDRLVLDEIHTIRNPNSKINWTVGNIKCNIRWGLSGTPINNRLNDIRSLIKFCSNVKDERFISNDVISTFVASNLLRRVKEKVLLKPLPPLDIINVLINFQSEKEIELYKMIHNNVINKLNRLYDININDIGDLPVMTLRVFEQIIRLRQVTICPMLVVNSLNSKQYRRNPIDLWDKTDTPRFPKYRDMGIGSDTGNMSKLNYLINDMLKDDKCVYTNIVFSHFRAELDLYEGLLKSKGLSVGRIDGSVSRKNRQVILDKYKFNKFLVKEIIYRKTNLSFKSYENCHISNKIFRHASYDVLLIQIDCGGTGLNLQPANRIYITSPHYNPAIEMQAIARSHRIGQDQKVVVKRLLMKLPEEETIDTHIVGIQYKKIGIMVNTLNDSSYKLSMIDIEY